MLKEYTTPLKESIDADKNVFDLLADRAQRTPEQTIVAYRGSDGEWTGFTATQFRDLVVAIAKGLIAKGLMPGDSVGILAHTSWQWTALDFAIMSIGCVTVPIYETDSALQIRSICNDSTISYVFAEDDEQRDKAESVKDECPTLRDIYVLQTGAIDAIEELGEGVSDAEFEERRAATHGDVLATIVYTSGSTGTPKGVMLNHGALMRGALNGTYRDGTMFGQTMVAALPFTHVFGMVFSMLSGLYTGSHMAVCGNMRDLFKEMARAKPTTMIAVPGMAEMMLTVAQKRGVQALGGRLKLIICGAAPVPERLMYSFKPYGIRVLSGYGMTETANLVCGNLEQETHPDSVGRQYPCQEARIVNGELQVKGDMLFSGYWKDEATTRAAFDGDWLKSGDLARVDEDGFIHIIGRIKNLIILGNGENVSPEEVEEVFYRSVCVQDCLVSETEIAGRPAIQLEVFPIDDVTDETLEQEMKRISDALPTTMRPARILIRHEPFEKSASLKIIRKK